MASLNAVPRVDIPAGCTALERDIPRVLKLLDAPDIESLGWTRPNKLALLVPLMARRDGKADSYLLKLAFHAYPEWPPSAQFVNPTTGEYAGVCDQHHIPQLTSQECHTHAAYPKPGSGPVQLICCSATLEFYEVAHGVQPEYLWDGRCTFYTTLAAIQRAMASHYNGRFPLHG
jgi:hypothetical protein